MNDLTKVSEHFATIITRKIKAAKVGEKSKETAVELDSHADMPVVGRNAYIIESLDKMVMVGGFTDALGKDMRVPVVNAAVIYECEDSDDRYIIVIRNALYVRNMVECLVPPNIIRLADVVVDECPKWMAKTPTMENHSIFFPNSGEHGFRIHLKLKGLISYFPCRTPTDSEMNSGDLPILELTPEGEWNHQDAVFSKNEEAMVDFDGNIKEASRPRFIISAVVGRTADPALLAQDLVSRYGDPGDKQELVGVEVKAVRTTIEQMQDARKLAKLWNIPVDLARKTLDSTTQRVTRKTSGTTMHRRYSTNDRMLRYKRLNCRLFTDTMYANEKKAKSTRGNTCAQVYASDFGFVYFVPMKAERDLAKSHKQLFKEFGAPEAFILDRAKAQIEGEAAKLCDLADVTIVELEKKVPQSNLAERYIQMLKNGIKDDLKESNSPLALWDYCGERRAQILISTVRDNFLSNGQPPNSIATGQPTDISNICEFGWYEVVKYRHEDQAFPLPTEKIGRCLGPAKNKGNMMSQMILTEGLQFLPIQTIQKLTPAERNDPVVREKIKILDEKIAKRFGDSTGKSNIVVEDVDEDDEDDNERIPVENDSPKILDMDDFEDVDQYIGMEVCLPLNGEYMTAGTVVSRAISDGKVKGRFDKNPILDTRIYDVKFPDGSIKQYSANIIAQNMYSQVDEDGYRYQLLESIMDHRKMSDAVDEEFETLSNGQRRRPKTTIGWDIHVQWRDGTTTWIPLKEVKGDYPIELAEYACAHGLEKEPAFAWWVPFTLKKRDHVISAVKRRVKNRNQKYGIEVPKNVNHAYELDRKNGNTYWRDAIVKEMKNVRIAFEILDDGRVVPNGYKFMPTYMVFDVKMDFTRKARFVANGSKSPEPQGSTYAGVVSRESVRIALTYAALMGLDVWAADVQNAYLQAPTTEKFYAICGPEFGTENIGRRAIIVRALYGMKSSGQDFRNWLRKCLSETLGWEHSLADPDVWYRKAIRHDDNGNEEIYYEYLLLYTDDCLCVSHKGKEALMQIDEFFKLKRDSIGPPKIYLGAKLSKVVLPNGVEAWSMSSSQYVQEAVRNVEDHLKEQGRALSKGTNAPLSTGYRPEDDVTEELGDEDASYYQSLIGVLRWINEIGRIDITCEISMMSSMVACPREGHLAQLYHMFSYFKKHHNARIVMDPTYPSIDENDFELQDWVSFYGSLTEELPKNMPESLGAEMFIVVYVDADHATDKVTRKSRTGFIVLLNGAPIYWYSKKQAGIETSSYGSEFVAMRTCCEYLKGLRYRLRMMGIPVNHPCFVYGDNKSVLVNCSKPDSLLKKKAHGISYHYVREGVAKNEWRLAYCNTEDNFADPMTKNLPAGANRYRKIRGIMYDIYPEGQY